MNHLHRSTSTFIFILLFFLYSLVHLPFATAQGPFSDDDDDDSSSDGINYTRATIVFAIIAVVILVIYFSYDFLYVHIYLRRIRNNIHGNNRPAKPKGLDPNVLKTFPVFVYNDKAEAARPGIGLVDCAICLATFEKDETLRMLPKCGHVFHVECLDPWLVGHSTCPVCRANLVPQPGDVARTMGGGVEARRDEVVVDIREQYEVVEVNRPVEVNGTRVVCQIS